MADPQFENPILAEIYDSFDGNRVDLENYLSLVKELDAKKILDIGCGTGCFAKILIENNFEVIGLEPAKASLDIAKKKISSDKVQWIHGYSSQLNHHEVDLAIMTGNVAQVFIEDEEWERNLIDFRKALAPNGYLVFETRDPSKKAWLEWNRENTYTKIEIPNVGPVEGWCELQEVSGRLVHFRWSYHFENRGETITSDSTLCFRSKEEIELSLKKTGYEVSEIRDAPERPGKEFVFIAKKVD